MLDVSNCRTCGFIGMGVTAGFPLEVCGSTYGETSASLSAIALLQASRRNTETPAALSTGGSKAGRWALVVYSTWR